jgi:hypothetical protein
MQVEQSKNTDDIVWMEWTDIGDNIRKYFALSEDTGMYWTEDTSDPNIVNMYDLEIRYTVEDTIKQIAEKYKMHTGKQFERFNLFKHPDKGEHAWLAVSKESTGKRDEEGKIIRKYKAFFSRRFKSVLCVSRLTGRPQGNPKFQDKSYAKEASARAKAERKKRLANAQETAKKLNFDPMKRLALYAMGDKERLGLKEEIKPSLQLKSLEIYLKYSHQQMKPYSPQEMEKLKGSDQGPKINIVLPSDGSEDKNHVIEHKNTESLESYLKYGRYDMEEEDIDSDDAPEKELQQIRTRLNLPDEN